MWKIEKFKMGLLNAIISDDSEPINHELVTLFIIDGAKKAARLYGWFHTTCRYSMKKKVRENSHYKEHINESKQISFDIRK